jgi:septal ring factor EnvC (AmiA/AmiB activator)
VHFLCCFTDLTQKIKDSENVVATLTAEVQKFELEMGDLQRKLQASDEKCSQLTQQKQKLVRHLNRRCYGLVDISGYHMLW